MVKTIIEFVSIFLFIAVFSVAALCKEAKQEGPSPVTYLPAETYQFEPVIEGVTVTHDFIIRNRGKATLQIFTVRSSCGCTTTSYTNTIAPGDEGKISLKFNSSGYGGKTVTKTTYVTTNDPALPDFTLTITGAVDSLAEINPKRAVLLGSVSDIIKAEITITPNKKYPFKITKTRVKKGENISYELKETAGADGTQYILTVINTRKTAGKYNDSIYLTMDNEQKTQLKIDVAAEIE